MKNYNPFDLIEARLDVIESLLLDIKHPKQAATPKQKDELLTRKQVSEILKISLVTLHHYTKSGLIPAVRIGKNIRFKESEIQNALSKIETLKYRR